MRKVVLTVLVGSIISIAISLWPHIAVSPDEPLLTMHVLDVGQGDAIFLEWQDGTQMLVDGGVDSRVLVELGRVMAPWDRSIDYIVATHPHGDHIGGLVDVLDRYRVESIVYEPVDYWSPIYEAFKDRVDREGAAVLPLVKWEIEGVRALGSDRASDDVNDASIILEIDSGVHKFLLMGDASSVVESLIIDELEDVDVLKVGHHGSKASTSREFLDAVRPEVSIISVGEENDYYHPHFTTLKRLEDADSTVYRTDLDGTITVESYEDGLRVR